MSGEREANSRDVYQKKIGNRLTSSLRRTRTTAIAMVIVGALGGYAKSKVSEAEPVTYGLLGGGVIASYVERRRAYNFADDTVTDFGVAIGSSGDRYGYTELKADNGQLVERDITDSETVLIEKQTELVQEMGSVSSLTSGVTGIYTGEILSGKDLESALTLGGAMLFSTAVLTYFDGNRVRDAISGYSGQLVNLEQSIRFRGPDETT